MRIFNRKTISLFLSAILLAMFAVVIGCGNGGGGGGAVVIPPSTSSGDSSNTGDTSDTGDTGDTGSTGGDTSDTTAPALAMIYPEPDSSFSESIFRAETFYIQFSYSDTSAMKESTLSVTFQMDDDPVEDITDYFSAINSENIKSTGIYAFNRDLYVMPTNTVNRLMKVYISIDDSAGNTGTASAQFTVLPVAPPRTAGD